jgi:hypothetical protein
MADFEKLGDGRVRVNVGREEVVISKLYGPMIFADIAIRPVMEGDDAYWLVMRNGKEWCRIEAQVDGDFEDDVES